MRIDAAVGPTTVSVKVRSRWDDCDRYDHVNNAAYLALVRAAHNRAGLPAGELRTVEITYRQPVPPEVTVGVDISVLVGRIRLAPEHLLRDLFRGEPSA